MDDGDAAVFAAILAAGTSSRFGATKQLETFAGTPLAARACRAAAAAFGARTALIVGHDMHAVMQACMPMPGFLVVNDAYAAGVGTSIARAARALDHVADAIVIVLADQPLVTSTHLAALADRWTGGNIDIVATRFADTLGPPCLFGRRCFLELASLTGDTGARAVLNDRRFELHEVVFEPAAVDIDRVADIAAASERLADTQD